MLPFCLFAYFNLNEGLCAGHTVVTAFPLALHFDPVLWSRLSGVPEVKWFQWVRPLFREELQSHCCLFVCRSVGRVVGMRASQDVDWTFLGKQRQIDLFSEHPACHQHLDDERSMTAGDTRPSARFDVSFLRQILRDLQIALWSFLLDAANSGRHVAFVEVLQESAIVQEQIEID